jgi:apolipoprotein N-acyltransferase
VSGLISAHVQNEATPLASLPSSGRSEWHWRIVAALSGALLGFAAPGLEQWYLPWFLPASLLLLAFASRDPWMAGVRGFCFGLGYNLVYLSWLLTFRAAYCEGTFAFCPQFAAVAIWLMLAAWQALYVSIFPCLIKALPLISGWLPVRVEKKWHWPTFVVLPVFWILIDRMCNTTQLLGFPWSSLHYSQYKQLVVIQTASLIGGVGISAWIMLVNANLAALLVSNVRGRERLAAIAFANRRRLFGHTSLTVLLSMSFLWFGISRLERERRVEKKTVLFSALQAGRSVKAHQVSAIDVLNTYFELSAKNPANSVCVWPEWAIALNFRTNAACLNMASQIAARNKQAWVLGIFDKDPEQRLFNSVCAFTQEGKVLPDIYHKRYLVPVGEYTPDWIRLTPLGTALYGFGKKYNEVSSGERAVVFDLKKVKVTPVVCFENVSPQICSAGVRAGGEVLIDSSDNSWFRLSILSDQMVSFCVMRAVENHRSFVFATALGPSTIIDSSGHILCQAGREEPATISAWLPIEHDITPYTRWCF